MKFETLYIVTAVVISDQTFYLPKVNHRLRGSASTVLTATGKVNGKRQILTPYRIATDEPIATKFHTIDYVHQRIP